MVVQNDDGTVGGAAIDPWVDWDQVIRDRQNPGDADPVPADEVGAVLDAGGVELNVLRAGDGITDYHEDADDHAAEATPNNSMGGCYGEYATNCGELEYRTPEGGGYPEPTPTVGGSETSGGSTGPMPRDGDETVPSGGTPSGGHVDRP